MLNVNEPNGTGPLRPRTGTGAVDPVAAPVTPAAPPPAGEPAVAVVADQTRTVPAGETSGYELANTPLVVKNGATEGDLIPSHIKDYKAPLDPSKLSADDMNRFNLVQQIFQMKTESASAAAHGTEHDISSKASAQTKKAEPKKKKKGGFFSKLKNLVAKILPVLTLITMFVPGLQVLSMALKVAQMAMKAIQMIEAIKNGDWKSALGAVAGMAGSLGGPLGEVAKWGAKGMEVVKAVENGGLAGGLGAMGNLFGGEVGGYLNTASKAVSAIESGDPMAMLDAVGASGALKGTLDDKTFGMLKDAVGVANGVVKGDAEAILKNLGSAAGAAGFEGADEIAKYASVAGAFASGDTEKLFSAVKESGVLPKNVENTLNNVVPKALEAYKAFDSGDVGKMIDVAGQYMPEDFKKTLTEAYHSEALNEVDDALGLGLIPNKEPAQP